MLILAGVSLNAVIGDNGIITQAQNATYMQGIAALEEYLQTEYVRYFDEADEYTNKIELLSNKMSNLCLKDGTKNYITYDGKMYYLVNKQSLPDDIKNQLRGGDTTEYSKYIRLEDVYGITSDLRVYYCADGLDGALGTLTDLELDPNTPLVKVNNDTEMKSALTEALEAIGITVGEEGITAGDIASLKDFELDGSKYNITSLSAISELTSLQTLTLKNINLSNLDGIESCSLLYYIYLKDCRIGDYSKLSTVLDLKYLYIYLSPNINETDANAQITNLGNGLANATSLNELEYFGISGVTAFFEESYTFSIGDSKTKYTYASNTRSNVTDISGLSKFAQNIKSSIKYMYLNNNKISSIEALENFSSIYELDLMCNSTLSNLKGLENHSSIVYLTVHSCNLTDISGLQGTTGLKYFTIQNNSNLTSLNGLEQSMSLDTMLAYSCNITDITSLANHTNLKYLSLYSNVNLENVITLGSLTGLKELYLASNEKMIGTEVRDALADPTTHILQNCGGNYSIPSKYNIYFATLTSYDYSNMNLTDDSDEINALKNRTNVTRLNLSGNSNLSNAKLQEILSTMTGLQYLSLNGCINLTSIDFIGQGKVTKLIELDLIDTASSLTNLSNLNNYATSLVRLYINNTKIDMYSMQTTINRIGMVCGTGATSNGFEYKDSWYSSNSWSQNGIHLYGNLNEYDFSNCNSIEYFTMRSTTCYGTLDLSKCQNLKYCDIRYNSGNYIIPSNIISLGIVDISGKINIDANEDNVATLKNLTTLQISETQLSELLNNNGLKNIEKFQCNRVVLSSLEILDVFDCSSITEMFLGSDGELGNPTFTNLNNIEKLTGLKILNIYNCPKLENASSLLGLSHLESLTINMCKMLKELPVLNSNSLSSISVKNTGLSIIDEIRNLTNIVNLSLCNNKISNISALSNLKNLTSLTLNDNNITDLSPLESLIENGKIKFTSLDLSNNVLQTTTVGGHNNVDTLIKLYDAGLRTLNISGNNFTPGSTDSLKNLGWTSYTE